MSRLYIFPQEIISGASREKSNNCFSQGKYLHPIVWRIHVGTPSLANSCSSVQLETINKEGKVCACKSFLKGQAGRLDWMGAIHHAIVWVRKERRLAGFRIVCYWLVMWMDCQRIPKQVNQATKKFSDTSVSRMGEAWGNPSRLWTNS